MIVPRFTIFTENFVIRRNQVTRIFRSGHDSTSRSSARKPCYFRLQADITIRILREVSIDTVCLPGPGTTFAPGSIGNSWVELGEYWCGWTFLSTRFSLKSWSSSGTSCNSPLRNSSSSSFLFVFLVSADPRDGFHRHSSPMNSLLSVTGFSVRITESCDDDVEESGEDEVEELFRQTMDYEWYIVWSIANNSFAIFGEMWFLTTGPVLGIPMILAELPETKNCGSFFKKQNCHE